MSYGPQLPASFVSTHEEEEEEDSPNVYGPVIPKSTQSSSSCGSTIPSRENTEEVDKEVPDVIGPQIPKVSEKETIEEEDDEDYDEGGNSYGPTLPSNFQVQAGPALPPQFDSDEDDIGPMPVSESNKEREDFERAYRLAMQKEAEDEEKNNQPKREEWMTSVPKKLGNFGLGARTFKTGTAVERDASWEDAPGAKKKRKNEEKTLMSAGIAAADARQAAIVDQKAKGPTLFELHQKQRQEKVAEMSYGEGERRPFDREKDMEVRGLKPGAGKETVDKMKEFASRFASSKDQRFL